MFDLDFSAAAISFLSDSVIFITIRWISFRSCCTKQHLMTPRLLRCPADVVPACTVVTCGVSVYWKPLSRSHALYVLNSNISQISCVLLSTLREPSALRFYKLFRSLSSSVEGFNCFHFNMMSIPGTGGLLFLACSLNIHFFSPKAFYVLFLLYHIIVWT